MYIAPKIISSLSKEELLKKLAEQNDNVELYGCPSGGTYSNCMNS